MFLLSLLTNKDSHNAQIIQCVNDTIFRKRFRVRGFGTSSGTLEPVHYNRFYVKSLPFVWTLQQPRCWLDVVYLLQVSNVLRISEIYVVTWRASLHDSVSDSSEMYLGVCNTVYDSVVVPDTVWGGTVTVHRTYSSKMCCWKCSIVLQHGHWRIAA